jgi:hypothetical protein
MINNSEASLKQGPAWRGLVYLGYTSATIIQQKTVAEHIPS